MPHGNFTLADARRLADALDAERVDYLIIGQGAAILMGFPGTTQDVDLFLPKSRANAEALIRALERLDFPLEPVDLIAILMGSEMVLLRGGPFALDLFHELDGVEGFEAAKLRSVLTPSQLRALSLDDVIATKATANRAKDRTSLPLLESFRRHLGGQTEADDSND